jgi:hypothetical protein
MSRTDVSQTSARRWPRLFRRGPMETLAVILIAAGFLMMFQPLVLELYSYSFITLLAGTLMFIVVTKFPE